jgi:hypothetical protein
MNPRAEIAHDSRKRDSASRFASPARLSSRKNRHILRNRESIRLVE